MIRPADIVFSQTVRETQARKGSHDIYKDVEMGDSIDDNLAAYIGQVRSFYLGSANADGQPYIQHRGGPPGFLKVLDEKTLAFADFKGNRQFISTGNFTENNKAYMFLMDYARRQRIKLWGVAEVIEEDDELEVELFPAGYRARTEQLIKFTVTAWDANCPQHIPQMFHAEDVARHIDELQSKIDSLESELTMLRASN